VARGCLSRHPGLQVNFEFFDRNYRTRPTFRFPTAYSIRMQPIARPGDGTTWAFPLNDLPEPYEEEGGAPAACCQRISTKLRSHGAGRPAEGTHTQEWLLWRFLADAVPAAKRARQEDVDADEEKV
jgi:hypothetical protein